MVIGKLGRGSLSNDQAVTSFKLEKPAFTASSAFSSRHFAEARPTVALLGIVRKKEVLFVQSSRLASNEDKPSWTLPQGGVEFGRTVYHALSNELTQEIGMPYTAAKLREMAVQDQLAWLGAYTNTVRTKAGSDNKPKYIVTAAMPLMNPSRIKLNEDNRKHAFVADQHALWALLKNTRSLKRLAICHIINRAHALGFIEWSCNEVVGLFNHSEAVAA